MAVFTDGKALKIRPFPSSPQPPFQSEGKCEVFVMKISFHIEIRTTYYNKNFALRLALKERLRGTRKWPICLISKRGRYCTASFEC